MKTSHVEAFLKSLVDSPSPTSKQSDVRRTHKILADALNAMGFTTSWVRDPSGKTDDLLVAEKPAMKTNGGAASFVTCVSHIDTVLAPAEAGNYRREENANGLRARGAGIIDNKGGLAVLVESLRLYFGTTPKPEIGFRVVSSPDEENGSSAWHEAFREIGTRSVAVLGFEPALDDGAIISSRRGNRWYNIEIKGIEAHAGRCKGEEINAAHEAARMTVRMLELRDRLRMQFKNAPGLGISLNVGHIEGGRDRHNVVCGLVRLKLDTRFSSFEEREALHSEIVKVFETPFEKNDRGQTAEIRFDIVDDCPPFAEHAATEILVKELCSKIEGIENRTISSSKAGGAGDVNHMSRPDLLILDGLGPVGGRMHTTEEFIELSTLQSRAQALSDWYPSLIRHCEKN